MTSYYTESTGAIRMNRKQAELPKLIKKGDTVLVKASHSMRLEEVSEALKLLK